MKRVYAVHSRWLLWFAAAACVPAPSGSQVPGEPAEAYPGFGLALVRAVVEREPGSNVFLSPASAAFALAMTSAGAAGSTWTGMAHVLGADPAQQAALGPANAAELSSLAKQSGVELDIANSVWASADRPILRSFLDESRRWYDAQVTSLVLHGPRAEDRINRWVAEATKGKIPGILADTLPDSVTMVLVNAVYFKGAWRGAFDSTQSKPHPFTLGDGSVTSRVLMSRWDRLLYARDTGMQIVRLPYRGGRVAMYVILPDSLAPPGGVTARLDTAHWGRWVRAMGSREVHVLLPRLHLETGRSLVAPPPIQFVVDRPYWIVIRDDRTGLILFMGHIVNPSSD